MTDRQAIRIRRYHPQDREQVMAIAPRLAEWVVPWRDSAAVLRAAQGWVRTSRPAHRMRYQHFRDPSHPPLPASHSRIFHHARSLTARGISLSVRIVYMGP